MKNFAKCLLVLLILSVSVVAQAGDHPQLPPNNSSPELNRIKSLAGLWVTTSSMFTGKPEKLYTKYEVTSNGSAVLERIFPGTPNEMISVYYDDHGKLAMTHYCMMRNRPSLKLKKATGDTLVMKVVHVGDFKKGDHAMGDITLHFKDKNHFSSTCSSKDKKEKPMTMEFTRVR